MRKLWKNIPIYLAVLALSCLVPALQAKAASASHVGQSDEHSMVAKGELVKVDTEHQTFTIKDQGDSELQFLYNSSTEVVGSTEGVQGLSSETGTRVTVYYKEESGQRIATKIEIQKTEPGH
jgi:hypothetical protein